MRGETKGRAEGRPEEGERGGETRARGEGEGRPEEGERRGETRGGERGRGDQGSGEGRPEEGERVRVRGERLVQRERWETKGEEFSRQGKEKW